MTRLLVRGMLARKLRVALTGIAVLLGVAMITGTYVLTDQVSRAFDDIFASANKGVDVAVLPRSEFTSSFTELPALPASTIDRVRRVPGVAKAAGGIEGSGSLVVGGKYLGKDSRAPSLVFSTVPEPFTPAKVTEGHLPVSHGQVAIDEKFATDNRLRLGERAGLATRTGVRPVTIVGIFRFGSQESVGAASLISTTFADAQVWFDRRGQTSQVVAAARPGVSPERLAAAIRAVLPRSMEVKTGRERAAEQAKQINDQLGSFLTPMLLALAGAALLVGAFIIFNTFSITVAQRVREFALLRTLGATRGQVLYAVAGEALLLAAIASALGIAVGVGFATLLTSLFSAVGFDLPTSGLVLQPRTVIVATSVGLLVTLLAALLPALRATRVPEAAAIREGIRLPRSRLSRYTPFIAAAITLLGIAGLLQGLFGSGPAESTIAAVGGGAVLVFVGIAMSARWAVRPVAGAIGWLLERLFRTTGRLARENAQRNPSRTAVTSAALMVGLALVVFVAVFASGLKASISDSLTRLLRADMLVTAQSGATMQIPGPTAAAVARVPGVRTAEAVRFDQVRVNAARKTKLTTDTVEGVDPRTIRDVYAPRWLAGGSDALFGQLSGDGALMEEQFAKTHGISVGQRFRVTSPSGRSATLTAIGEYRDPQIFQGVIVADSTFPRISSARDPFIVLVRTAPGADPKAVQGAVERALRAFPSAKVQSQAQYRKQIEDQLNQLVFLLYALLAMSVVISIFGIANSLALSIHERTREIGTLEAIGATDRQVRRMIRYESVITAAIGGVLGVLVGLLFAWLMTESLSDLGLVFSVPAGQLVVFLVLALAVGVLAAVGPARRGARIDVLEALHYE